MMQRRFSHLSIWVLSLSFVFLSSEFLWAGEGFKGKIQKKIINLKNIQYQQADQQYEPYYAPQSEALDLKRDKDSRAPAEAPVTVQAPMKEIEGDEFAMKNEMAQRICNERLDRTQPGAMMRYAIYQADYKAELEENVVTVKGEVVFQIFEKGWTQLPLVRNDVGLLDVSVNRGAAFVTMIGDKYYLMIDKPGRYTLSIEYLIKANRERENGPGQFTFEMMPAPISQFEFTMLETGVEIFVEPAIKVEVRKEGPKTVAWAIMPNTRSVTARWTKELHKEEIKSVQLEPKVYAENTTYASLGEGVLRCQTTLNYSILQSEVSSFRVALPKDVSVLDVQGRDLRDWKVSSAENGQYLDVYVNFGIKGNYVLSLTYEKNIGEGSIVAEVPVVQALGVERETGSVGIAARTNVELAVNKAEHVTAIDVKELPSTIWNNSTNPILLAFKYLKHPFSISIQVTRHEELPVLVAAVDSAQAVTLFTPEGKRLTKVTYAVRNNVKQFLRMNLPKGATLWSAFVSGKPVKPAKDRNSSILIPLEKSQLQGESLTHFNVEVVYLDQGAKLGGLGQIRMDVPRIDIPVSEFAWAVSVPVEYRYFGFGGDMHPVEGGYQRSNYLAGSRGGFMQRGLQGRLRSASDEIGTQFAMEAKQMMSVPQQTVATGILPIRIEIPQSGMTLNFSKLLVTENESPALTMRYVRAFRKVEGFVRFVLFIVVVVLLVRLIKRGKKAKV